MSDTAAAPIDGTIAAVGQEDAAMIDLPSDPQSSEAVSAVEQDSNGVSVASRGTKPVQTREQVDVTEGSATIVFPSPRDVFYNPVQQFNRDLSTLAIRAWSRGFLAKKQAKLDRQHAHKQQKRSKTQVVAPVATVVDPASENAASDDTAQQGTKRKRDDSDSPAVATDVAAGTSGEPRKEAPNRSSAAPAAAQTSTTTSFKAKFSILEALSATGLRAIRYSQEIPNVEFVVANDLSPGAVKQIQSNVSTNTELAQRLVRPQEADARAAMYTAAIGKRKFACIDLDPYGSAAPFIDGAVQAVDDGGLLCITCTDLAVLAGDSYPEKCFSQYGGMSCRQSEFCHEQALRLVLNSVAQAAARYGRSITPLMSLSIDFYVRLWVRVQTSPVEVKRLASQTGIVYHCTGCRSWTIQALGNCKEPTAAEDADEAAGDAVEQNGRKHGKKKGNKLPKYTQAMAKAAGDPCGQCGFPNSVGGPMWTGPLHDEEFIRDLMAQTELPECSSDVPREDALYRPWYTATMPRIRGMLQLALDEIGLPPLHWNIARLAKTFHCEAPPTQALLSALLNLGHRVSNVHTRPGCVKTDAPAEVVWQVMRAWYRSRFDGKIPEGRIAPGQPGYGILFPESMARHNSRSQASSADDDASGAPAASEAVPTTEEPEISFRTHPEAVKLQSRKAGSVRYQENPTDNWGPKMRARGPDESWRHRSQKENK